MIPGFNTVLTWAPGMDIKPEDAYLCAIQFMYDLASSGWEKAIPSGHEAYSREVNGIKVAFGSLAEPGDEYQLRNKHLILGLLEVMNTMANKMSFCNTKAALYMYRKRVGQLVIGRPLHPSLIRQNDTNVTLNDMNSNTVTRSLTIEREIVDPEDSDFVISYEMSGDPIPCQALLSAAVNALANSAPASIDDRCTNSGGFSSKGEVACVIFGNPPMTTLFVLTYGLVRTALRLLPARLYSDESCGEVKFDFIYRGEELGGGSFYLA